jgi:hypothetical protein
VRECRRQAAARRAGGGAAAERLADDFYWQSTVDGLLPGSGDGACHARAYCRNLKTKRGEPYGRIRLEAEQRFDPKQCPLESAEQPAFIAAIWKGRYANLASRVTRLAREVQVIELAGRMRRGELSHGQAERLHLFLDLERLGLARQCYRGSVYAARRREATRLGYSADENGSNGLGVELADLLAAYVRAVDEP